MESLKALFRFYINASIHVALAVVALTALTALEHGLNLDISFLLFLFLSTVTAYNFVKYAPLAKLYHKRLTDQLKQIQLFSLLVFIVLCVNVWFVNMQILVVSSFSALLTLLYAIPIGRKNLRETSVLKVFIIALIWTITTLGLPFFYNFSEIPPLTLPYFLLCLERFSIVLLLMIPFEIRDYRFDRHRIMTLVTVFGLNQIKKLAFTLLILLTLLSVYQRQEEALWFYLVMYSSLGFFIYSAKEIQHPYFASFWVESLPIFWFLLKILIYI